MGKVGALLLLAACLDMDAYVTDFVSRVRLANLDAEKGGRP